MNKIVMSKTSQSHHFRFKSGDHVQTRLGGKYITGRIVEGILSKKGTVCYEIRTDDGLFFAVNEKMLENSAGREKS